MATAANQRFVASPFRSFTRQDFDISPAEGEYLRCALRSRNGADLRAHVFALAREHGWSLRELTRDRCSLEDIYVRVTRPEEEEES